MSCAWACEGAVFVEYILSYYNSAVFVAYRVSSLTVVQLEITVKLCLEANKIVFG